MRSSTNSVATVIFKRLLRPWLFLLAPEIAHGWGFGAWRMCVALPLVGRFLRRNFTVTDPALRVHALGLEFPNPVGLAAGFDKNAVGYEAMTSMGFGFIEIGTVTPRPQSGNPRPRLFRLAKDGALINRLGFNNDGAEKVAERLSRSRKTIVGINIGKNRTTPNERAIDDYVFCAEVLTPYAGYVVVNVSSPNTPGLRELQSVDVLGPLLATVRNTMDRAVPERHVPLLIKIAPDLSDPETDQIADLALDLKLDGIIATNTTLDRGALAGSSSKHHLEQGGLSGPPVKERSLSILRRLKKRVGESVVLISCGGITTPEDACERLEAGATLIQLYTALIYEGPGLPGSINHALLLRSRSKISSPGA